MKFYNKCERGNNQDIKFDTSIGFNLDNQPIEVISQTDKNKQNKILLASAILTTLYVVYLIFELINLIKDITGFSSSVVTSLVTALFIPHIITMALGSIFSWLSICFKKTWSSLVAAILYCVASIILPLLAKFCIPLIILAFIGYAKQKKLLKKQNN